MSLSTKGFTGPLEGAQKSLSGMVGSLTNALAPLAAMAGVTLTVGGAMAGLKMALDMGGEFTDLKARTGESIEKLAVFRQALDDCGVGAGSAGQLIGIMQKSLTGVSESGEPTSKAFEALNLNLADLRKLSPVDQVKAIGAALGKVAEPAKQTGLAMQIFGRSGGEMKQFFADPNAMNAAAKSLGSMPALLAKNAELFDGISDSIGRLKGKGQALFVGIADKLAGSLKPMIETIDAIDFAKVGQQIGSVIAKLAEAFKAGQLGGIIGDAVKIGLGDAANYFIGAMQTAGEILGKVVNRAFSGDFWSGLVDGFAGVGENIVAVLMEAFRTPMIYLQASVESVIGKFERLKSAMRVGYAPEDKKEEVAKQERERLAGLGFLKSESVGQIAERRNKEELEFGIGDGTMSAGDHKKAGAALLKSSMEKMQAPLAEMGKLIADSLANFNPSGMFDVEKWKTDLAKHIAGIKVAMGSIPSGDETKPAGDDLTAPVGKGAKLPDGDRLAKIGLFVGAGGPGADSARRIVDNTSKQNSLTANVIQKIDQLIQLTPGNSREAVWA